MTRFLIDLANGFATIRAAFDFYLIMSDNGIAKYIMEYEMKHVPQAGLDRPVRPILLSVLSREIYYLMKDS